MSNEVILYRVMSLEEYEKVLSDGFSIPNQNGFCPKKCLTDSLVHTYRFNSFVQNSKPTIARIKFSTKVLPFLTEGIKQISFRSYHRVDNFRSYEKYDGISFKYNAHGNSIPLSNYEIDREDLSYLNETMLDVSKMDREDYAKQLLRDLLLDDVFNATPDFSLTDDEYFLQLPYDYAVLALKYKEIPKGGLNKFVKARFFSKNLPQLDDINYNAFAVTVAVKINKANLLKGKLSLSQGQETFSIDATDLTRLNANILDIRFISYIKERNEYKFASNLINESITMSDVLNEGVLPEEETGDNIGLRSALDILKSNDEIFSKMKKLVEMYNEEFYSADTFHDKNHAERVCFYSMVIANYLKVDINLQNELLMASLFHDLGKKIQNENHGTIAIDILKELNIEVSSLTKFLVEAHEVNREDEQSLVLLLNKYEICDRVTAVNLLYILKDADALDRTRFSVFQKSQQDIDISFITYDVSKKLIDLANYLSKVFYNNSSIKDKILIRK